jgi:hypothetical protein
MTIKGTRSAANSDEGLTRAARSVS